MLHILYGIVDPVYIRALLPRNRKLYFLAGLMGMGIILGSHEWASACAGFLCGPKAELIAGLNQAEGSAQLINTAYLGLNSAVVFLISLPTLIGMGKNVGRDEIGWYIGGSILTFFVMLLLNFMGDWAFGLSGGTAGEAATGAGVGGATGAGGL